jgi:predicted transcriptional regulator
MKKTTKHREPSAESLREIPEVDLSHAERNPYARGIAIDGLQLQIGHRRPKVGTEVGPTETRTVRFPPQVWRAVERMAERRGLSTHAALRLAIVEWVQREDASSASSASDERDVASPRGKHQERRSRRERRSRETTRPGARPKLATG